MIASASAWPLGIPIPEKPGRVTLPTGREIFWTGSVAIGLRHKPAPNYSTPVPQSQLWVQELLLDSPAR